MWSISRPSQRTIAAFLAEQSGRAYSYAAVGASRHADVPAGFDLDHNRVQLGSGRRAFDAGCAALRRWQMFPAPWTSIHPPDTPLEPGRVVAVLAHAAGVWWLNSCRIVYVLDETSPLRRFGFAYGTLPAHVARGEERFSIEWGVDDVVWYDVRAFSLPQHPLVRLGYPLARRFQRRFARASLASMRQIVGAS
jgi:uncharacterized protein (UPF0548 family)